MAEQPVTRTLSAVSGRQKGDIMDTLVGLNLDEVRYTLDHAELSSSALSSADAMLGGADGYLESVRALDANLRALDGDRDLSDEGRRRHRGEAVQAWAAKAERTLADLDARAERMVKSVESQLSPPTLARDRLADAERHVLMMLEPVPLSSLPRVLRDLASSDEYPDVQHLLAVTKWGGMFLRSKGATGDAERWERERTALMRPLLSESGQRALDDLVPLREAARVPSLLWDLYDAERVRRGLRRTPPR